MYAVAHFSPKPMTVNNMAPSFSRLRKIKHDSSQKQANGTPTIHDEYATHLALNQLWDEEKKTYIPDVLLLIWVRTTTRTVSSRPSERPRVLPEDSLAHKAAIKPNQSPMLGVEVVKMQRTKKEIAILVPPGNFTLHLADWYP